MLKSERWVCLGLAVCLIGFQSNEASASAGQLATLPTPAEMSRLAQAALRGDGEAAYALSDAYATRGDGDIWTRWHRLSIHLRYVYALEYEAKQLTDSNDYCATRVGLLFYSQIFSRDSQWPHDKKGSIEHQWTLKQASGWRKDYRAARIKLARMKPQDCSKSLDFMP